MLPVDVTFDVSTRRTAVAMLRFGLFLALVAISSAGDYTAEKAEVAFLNIRGLLIPDRVGGAATRTFAFRTEGEDELEVDVTTFRCGPLDDLYVDDKSSRKPVLLCEGEVPVSVQGFNKKLVFLFGAEGLDLSPTEREINLLLGRNAISQLQVVTGKVIDEELERAKRQLEFNRAGTQQVSPVIIYG